MEFKFSKKDRMLEIYNYNEHTGEYLNAVTLKIEAHTGLPAHSTSKPLPELNSDQVAVFSDGEWHAKDDNRGVIWDIVTKEPSDYFEFGDVPGGKTKLEPNEFDDWDGNKWAIDSDAQLLAAQGGAAQQIKSFATDCRREIAGNHDHLETAEWSEKRLRALRVVDENPLTGDIEKLETEAQYRGKGESAAQLAEIVKGKAERFEHASIVITGMTSAAISAVKAATTAGEIDALYVSLKAKATEELQKLA